jgi:hypothetical protein
MFNIKMDQCLGECCGICFQIDCVDMCGSCCYTCAQSIALAPAAICSSDGCCKGNKEKKGGKYTEVSQAPDLMDMNREIQIQF